MNVISKIVKTRKPHRCWGCRVEFPAGSIMERAATFDGGSATTCYWCRACQHVINGMDPVETELGFNYGDIADEMPEQLAAARKELSE